MQAVATKKHWTDQELMALPHDGRKHELLGGELVVSPTGVEHGYISVRLVVALGQFVAEQRLGLVLDSSTGFRMKSGDCLSPDVSVVRMQRVRSQGGITPKFFRGAPDLAVEVISPRESRRRLKQKLTGYFANGTRLVWVVNPADKSVSVYTSIEQLEVLGVSDQLSGGSLLPGFVLPIQKLFEIW
jgi:Uma2 family endonuclease